MLDRADGEIDRHASALLHLAAVTRGVYYGSGGEFGLNTALGEEDVEFTLRALRDAIRDVAASDALGAGV